MQPSATSAAELVPALEQSVAKAKENLRAIDDAGLGEHLAGGGWATKR